MRVVYTLFAPIKSSLKSSMKTPLESFELDMLVVLI